MKKSTLFIVLLSFTAWGLSAQKVTFTHDTKQVKVITASGDTLKSPWAGGLANPTFSSIDLNFDGYKDIFVFDHLDSSVATYIYTGKNGNGEPVYKYAPEYAAYFPSLTTWATLVDYNHDGLPDIYAYSHQGGGIEVYKNISSGGVLKFKIIDSLIWISPNPLFQNGQVYADPSNIPAFVDIDGDGDIDILTIQVAASQVNLYKSRSADKYGTDYSKYDKMIYEENDDTWGALQGLGGLSATADSNVYCPTINVSGGLHYFKRQHAGCELTYLDIDGDGDMDALYSDINGAGICLLKNGRIEEKWKYDTITSVTSKYLGLILPYVPVAYYVDVDNDGKRDLLVSPLQLAYGSDEGINNVYYYQNSGADNKPVFNFKQKNFLQKDNIDLGYGAAPAFIDRNNDGIPESLAVSTRGNISDKVRGACKLVLYKNLNPASRPAVFKEVDSDWLGLSSLHEPYLMPAFGDLDGDGKQDLLLGTYLGKLIYYHNLGTSAKDSFVRETDSFIDKQIHLDSMGGRSAPAIADLDKDGIADIIIGCAAGNIYYYKGLGYKTVGSSKYLEYQLITPYFGNVFTVDPTWGEYIAASPCISDFDKDGKLDLMVGSSSGNLLLYMDIQANLSGTFKLEKNYLYNNLQNEYESFNFGLDVHPAAALLNSDSLPDVVVGNGKGGMYYLSSNKVILTVAPTVTEKAYFKVYPNPANNSLNVYCEEGLASYQLINMIGQNLLSHLNSVPAYNTSIDISNLPEGIYILQLRNARGGFSNEKVIIRK